MIAALYFVIGILFALWAATAFDDHSQWLVVAPICVVLWPLFIVGISAASLIMYVTDWLHR
jgi:uncharacterized membrane protein